MNKFSQMFVIFCFLTFSFFYTVFASTVIDKFKIEGIISVASTKALQAELLKKLDIKILDLNLNLILKFGMIISRDPELWDPQPQSQAHRNRGRIQKTRTDSCASISRSCQYSMSTPTVINSHMAHITVPSPPATILLTESILQVFLSYGLLVLESVGTQICVHVHDHFRSYRADNKSIWGSFS